MSASIKRLLRAIDYPGTVSPEAVSFTLVVDGGEMTASEADGRLVLAKRLAAAGDDFDLGRLAEYAAGRLLREEATLAWDPAEQVPILWQEMSADAAESGLRRFFEVFATSVDWWTARMRDVETYRHVPEMMIRP